MGYFGLMETELIRKTFGRPRDLTVFERVRRLNAELDRLGIRRPKGDGLVKKVIGWSRPKGNPSS
jgi:hypothetical protein